MVRPSRAAALVVLAAGMAAAGLWTWRRLGSGAAPGAGAASPARDEGGGVEALPRIALERLDGPRGDAAGAGARDLFAFGRAPAPALVASPPVPIVAPSLAPVGGTESLAPATPGPRLPPFSVTYVGTFDDRRGVRVAVLLSEKKEVFTGQEGELVANRLKIVKIGLESVDVEDVGGGGVRRIPLRGGS